MQNTKEVILVGDEKFYRVVWFTYINEKCVSAWIKNQDLALSWLKESNKSIPSELEETLNVSSLGGDTIESKTEELERIISRILSLCVVDDHERIENLQVQRDRIRADLTILKNNPNIKVIHIFDFEKIHKIVS